jgi:hypothetical protein
VNVIRETHKTFGLPAGSHELSFFSKSVISFPVRLSFVPDRTPSTPEGQLLAGPRERLSRLQTPSKLTSRVFLKFLIFEEALLSELIVFNFPFF